MFLKFLSIFVALSLSAKAVPVARGQTVDLSGSSFGERPEYGGFFVDSEIYSFEIKNSLDEVILQGKYAAGSLRSNVTGKLVFSGRVFDLVNPGGAAWVTNVELSGYGFVDTDVDYRTDGLGNTGPDRVTRSANGDRLNISHGVSIIAPPDSSRFYNIITQADESSPTGSVTITAFNDFGGSPFSTTITGVPVPVKVPLIVKTGDIFFFETQFWFDLKVSNAAVGVILGAESSETLTEDFWMPVEINGVPAQAGETSVFVPVTTSTILKQFFRITCSLPESG